MSLLALLFFALGLCFLAGDSLTPAQAWVYCVVIVSATYAARPVAPQLVYVRERDMQGDEEEEEDDEDDYRKTGRKYGFR